MFLIARRQLPWRPARKLCSWLYWGSFLPMRCILVGLAAQLGLPLTGSGWRVPQLHGCVTRAAMMLHAAWVWSMLFGAFWSRSCSVARSATPDLAPVCLTRCLQYPVMVPVFLREMQLVEHAPWWHTLACVGAQVRRRAPAGRAAAWDGSRDTGVCGLPCHCRALPMHDACHHCHLLPAGHPVHLQLCAAGPVADAAAQQAQPGRRCGQDRQARGGGARRQGAARDSAGTHTGQARGRQPSAPACPGPVKVSGPHPLE